MNPTTATAAALDLDANVSTTDALVKTANDRLQKTMGADSLDALVAATTRRSLLLCDTSGSMSMTTQTGERRIDALRKVVANLRETHPVPVAAFSGRGVRLVDEVIPEPNGGTPMAEAIDYGKQQGANHLCLVTDGEAGSEYQVFESARAFGGPIDTFYIGDGRDRGAHICQQIADMTGGTAHLTDLSKPKELAATMRLMLGDGSTI